MVLVDPKEVSLLPGQGIKAMFEPGPGIPGQLGLFVRSARESMPRNGDIHIEQRAGMVRFNDILLVVTMIKVDTLLTDEYFDVWWDYHSADGVDHFEQMADQERLVFHVYDAEGREFCIDRENGFRKFFANVPGVFRNTKQWTEIEFDRAVRGFCADSYPKENLWQVIEFRPHSKEASKGEPVSADEYLNNVPEDLRPFYLYLSDKGHCIRIIPSVFEQEASHGNPEEFLQPAPLKTVLRCGIRWAGGYPVAPIPFVPGHGLAVPPEDEEH